MKKSKEPTNHIYKAQGRPNKDYLPTISKPIREGTKIPTSFEDNFVYEPDCEPNDIFPEWDNKEAAVLF